MHTQAACTQNDAATVVPAGPWPTEATTMLPADYVPLAEACWARQRPKRPSAEDLLQRLLRMLAEVEAGQGQ